MHDIVVVGAGLAGSAVAAGLARLGRDVLLIERDQFPRHKVCGEFLSPESQASLYALGLYPAAAGLGPVPIHAARFVSPRGVALPIRLPATAWGLSRFALDAALAAAASKAGAELRNGTTVSALRREAGGYSLDLRTPQGQERIQARAAILACGRQILPGLRSAPAVKQAARHSSLITHHSESVGVKCHYAGLEMPAQVEIYLFDGGYAGLNNVEGGRANLCLLVTREAFRRAGANVTDMIAAAAQANPALGRRLNGARALPESACAVGGVDTQRPALPWDGVARLGDAATMIPPLCGDGMAMALRAAELCVPLADDFLARRADLATWERRYRAAWHAEFDARLRAGRQVQAVLSAPWLADGLLAAGHLLPWVAERLAHATRGPLRDLTTLRPLA